jgi:hypothetical protein
MKSKFEIKTVDAGNVDETGFFCYMSKRREPGYKQKRDWLEVRFAEGLKIKIIHETGGRDTAFIEYIPRRVCLACRPCGGIFGDSLSLGGGKRQGQAIWKPSHQGMSG